MPKSSNDLNALSQELDQLKKELKEERKARKEAEAQLTKKTAELSRSAGALSDLNKSLEKNITRRTNTLLSLIKNLQSGIILEDENNTLILANERFCEMFNINHNPKDLIGIDSAEIVNQTRHLFKEPEEYKALIEANSNEPQLSVNNKVELANGKFFEIDFIPVNSGDELLGHLWQFKDITERSLYEEMIRNSEEKYRSILENMELGLMEVDTNNVITKVYDRFCDMTGYTAIELIGQNAVEIFRCEDYENLVSVDGSNRSNGASAVFETTLRRKDGESIWVLISGAPFYDAQKQRIGSVGVHYDITDRKNLEHDLIEAREQADNAREAEKQFLANMSHEIRNPINAVVGLINLLYDTKLSPEQFEYINNIKYSAEVLMGLISDILDLSKIEAGKVELNEKEVDIREVVKAVVQTYSFKSIDKDISFFFDVDEKIDFPFFADPTIINQILLNLLGNAVKFTDKGRIEITTTLVEDYGDSCLVQFQISDTGIGIPTDQLTSIFQSFKQANKETKLKYGGTGLGLSIVKQLVEMYHGKISVESEEKEGSTFHFTLHLKKFDQSRDGLVSPAIKSTGQFELKRVLIVEDNKLNQQYLTWLLEKWDISYDVANHGMEALKLIEKEKYDLVLMDIRMPVMDGYETTIRIRNSTQNHNSTIPIIALTASALVDEKAKAIEVGMNHHLTKPFSPEQLKAVLDGLGGENIIEEDVGNDYRFSKELDSEYLMKFYGEDVDRAGLMFEIFLANIDQDLESLGKYFEEKDMESFSSLAHRIKPNFAMVGLPKYTELMKELELKGKSGDFIELEKIVPVFFKEFKEKKDIIVEELSNIKKHLGQ